jgi:KDO2-lipid IV(A) lauroyltransferase
VRPFRKIKRAAVYRFVLILSALLNVLPRKLAVAAGGWIGLAAWSLSGREQHRAIRHLTLAFGRQLSHRERILTARGFFINSGKNLADVLRFKKHFVREILPIIEYEGIERFDEACRRGRGVIGVTGHIGNFELLAALIRSRGFDVAVIGRELSNPGLDRLLLANREAVGLVTIATSESPKRMLSWLREGKVLGVLIDTDSHRVRGEFIPAFGRWSYTPVGQTILGLHVGAAFVPAVCVRTGDNRYKVIVCPEVTVDSSGDPETDVYNVTLRCTQALEQIIREYPDQWPWQHNRWRTRKAPEPRTA